MASPSSSQRTQPKRPIVPIVKPLVLPQLRKPISSSGSNHADPKSPVAIPTVVDKSTRRPPPVLPYSSYKKSHDPLDSSDVLTNNESKDPAQKLPDTQLKGTPSANSKKSAEGVSTKPLPLPSHDTSPRHTQPPSYPAPKPPSDPAPKPPSDPAPKPPSDSPDKTKKDEQKDHQSSPQTSSTAVPYMVSNIAGSKQATSSHDEYAYATVTPRIKPSPAAPPDPSQHTYTLPQKETSLIDDVLKSLSPELARECEAVAVSNKEGGGENKPRHYPQVKPKPKRRTPSGDKPSEPLPANLEKKNEPITNGVTADSDTSHSEGNPPGKPFDLESISNETGDATKTRTPPKPRRKAPPPPVKSLPSSKPISSKPIAAKCDSTKPDILQPCSPIIIQNNFAEGLERRLRQGSMSPPLERTQSNSSELRRSRSLPRNRGRRTQAADKQNSSTLGRDAKLLVKDNDSEDKRKGKLSKKFKKIFSGNPSQKKKVNPDSPASNEAEDCNHGNRPARSMAPPETNFLGYSEVDIMPRATKTSSKDQNQFSNAYEAIDISSKPPPKPKRTFKVSLKSLNRSQIPEGEDTHIYAQVKKSTTLPAKSNCVTTYEDVVFRERSQSVKKQASKLRISRALSAESFNLEGIEDMESSDSSHSPEVPPRKYLEDKKCSSPPSQLGPPDVCITAPTSSSQGDTSPSHQTTTATQQTEAQAPPPVAKRKPPPIPKPYSKHKEETLKKERRGISPSKSDGLLSQRNSTSATSFSGFAPGMPTAMKRNSNESPGAIFLPQTMIDLAPANPPPIVSSSTEDDQDDTDWEESGDEFDEWDEEEEPNKDRPKTYFLAKELLTTERTFVRRLKLLDEDFRGVFESYNRAHSKTAISEDALKQILSNIGSLKNLNKQFLGQLEARFKTWDSCPRIGDILLSIAPFLRMYSEYISNFDNALKVLDDNMKRNPVFLELVKEFEADPQCANLSVANYMLETVQRIPRYKILLQDYIKHLPEDSDDIADSKKALDCIAQVAQHVNESIRQVDNFKKLIEVEKKLIGDTGGGLITPTRKLLKEGEVTKFSRKERIPRMLFLFNDILIYASTVQPPSFTHYKVIRRIPLLGMKIVELDDPEVKHGFQILSTEKSFRLEASSEEDKNQWMMLSENAIKELRENENSRRDIRRRQTLTIHTKDPLSPPMTSLDVTLLGEYAPPWLPDSCVSMCMSCTAAFTMTRRRHHCRACGNIFCSSCSRYEATLKYREGRIDRVCQSCYETLKEKGVFVLSAKVLKKNKQSSSSVTIPQVLQQVKARDQNSEMSGYLSTKGSWGWKRRWFVLYNLALYSFEKHEDRAAKKSIIVPSHVLIYPFEDDPLQFALKHTGTGTTVFKGEDVNAIKRWTDVLSMAVKGETEVSNKIEPCHTSDED